MLVGISPLISPDLLATLARMGHGDEIVLADAHFPGESANLNCLRADGTTVSQLLDAILPLFALDTYADAAAFMMAPVEGDTPNAKLEADYSKSINAHWPATPPIAKVERFAFYEQAERAFAVVMTSDTAQYANLILKKGVTPVQS